MGGIKFNKVLLGCFAVFSCTAYAADVQAPQTGGVSGLNLKEFATSEQSKVQWANNPFIKPIDNVSVSELKLQGLVSSTLDEAALVNGEMVAQGDRIGSTEIVDVDGNRVVLRNGDGIFSISMKGAAAKPKLEKGTYLVEFRDAPLENVVRMLAKMSGLSIVVPEKVDGKVTASFESSNLYDAMKSILKTYGYGAVDDDGMVRVITKEDVKLMGEDLNTRSYNLGFAKAERILSNVQALLSERGTAIADDMTNSVHVRDTDQNLKGITQLISSVDKKGRQVLIEARIIEASNDFVRSLGIQWGITRTGGSIQSYGLKTVGTDDQGRNLMFNAPAVGINNGPALAGAGLILGSFKGILTDIQLSAAEEQGDVTVLARPTISTLNNQEASIRSGSKFYVKTNGNVSIGGISTPTNASNLQEIDTGIELKVTPQISDTGYIRMDISATQSEANFAKAVDGVPSVDDKSAQTTVSLMDGETTIIGGLFQLKDAKTVRGVPGLMKIPIMGNLFKGKTKTKARRELLIFLTPRIVDSAVASLPSFEEKDSVYNPDNIAAKEEAANKKAVIRNNRKYHNSK